MPARKVQSTEFIDHRQNSSMNNDLKTHHSKVLRAFTLIELLMVISIISILTLLATYSYNNAQAKARDSERKQELKNIKGVLQLYFEDKDTYPNSLNSLSTPPNPYLTEIPQDPKGGSYIYVFPTGSCPPTCYSLTACLENPNDSQKDAVKNSSCSTPASYTITNPG